MRGVLSLALIGHILLQGVSCSPTEVVGVKVTDPADRREALAMLDQLTVTSYTSVIVSAVGPVNIHSYFQILVAVFTYQMSDC